MNCYRRLTTRRANLSQSLFRGTLGGLEFAPGGGAEALRRVTDKLRGLVLVLTALVLVGWAIVGTAEAQRSKLLFEHPFIHAARNGDLAAVRYMIARGDTPEIRDHVGQTPLMIATIAGNIDIVEVIVAASNTLDSRDNNGNTALGLAAIQDQLEIATFLLESGANPNVVNRLGMTPLMLAAKNGRLIQAELMLQFKPDVSLKDYTGRGPLGWARQSRNPQIVRLLERAGFFD